MGHHSSEELPSTLLNQFWGQEQAMKVRDMLRKEAEVLKLGATGMFPDGKIADHDEGEIKIAIGADGATQTVIINFGKRVAFVGFSADQAIEVAEMLIAKAHQLRGIA